MSQELLRKSEETLHIDILKIRANQLSGAEQLLLVVGCFPRRRLPIFIGFPSTNRVNRHHHSPKGAEYVSPGRKPWVSGERDRVPEGRQTALNQSTLARPYSSPTFRKERERWAPGSSLHSIPNRAHNSSDYTALDGLSASLMWQVLIYRVSQLGNRQRL